MRRLPKFHRYWLHPVFLDTWDRNSGVSSDIEHRRGFESIGNAPDFDNSPGAQPIDLMPEGAVELVGKRI